MSEDPATYSNHPADCALDTIALDKCFDRIIHSAEMMRWNVIRKETDIQLRITGIHAWISEVKENLKSIENFIDQHEK